MEWWRGRIQLSNSIFVMRRYLANRIGYFSIKDLVHVLLLVSILAGTERYLESIYGRVNSLLFSDTTFTLSFYTAVASILVLSRKAIFRLTSRMENTGRITAIEKSGLSALIVLILALSLNWKDVSIGMSFPHIVAGSLLNSLLNEFIWLFTVMLFLRWQMPEKRIPGDDSKGSSFPLDDNPVDPEKDKDELDRGRLVKNLVELIRARKERKSFVFGLIGDWGSGKTSIFNIAEHQLRHFDAIKVIRYSPWYVESQEKLVESFFQTISKSLTEDQIHPSLSRELSQYYRMLVGTISNNWVDISAVLTSNSIETQKTTINSAVASSGRRYTVFVDDIDRLDELEIRLVFKLVRLCADFKGFTYVLAYDKKLVQKAFREQNERTGSSFADKIVQLEIPVPKPDQMTIDSFFSEYVDQLRDQFSIELDDGDKAVFRWAYRNGLNDLNNNIRFAKRLLNSVYLNFEAVKGEVNFVDFLVLEAIRLEFPQAYDEIYKSRDRFYQPKWSGDTLPAREFILLDQEKGDKDYLGPFYERNDKRGNDILMTLVSSIFTRAANASNKFHMSSYWTGEPSLEAARRKRIEHPDFFEQYFLFNVPSRRISQYSIDDFVSQLNNLPDGEFETFFEKTTQSYKDQNKFVLFLDNLLLRVESIREGRDVYLVRLICKASTRLSRARSITFDSEEDRSAALIFFNCPKVLRDDQRPRHPQHCG